jgi:hypothetical protein
MADNTTLNPGIGGDVIAADEVAGIKYQIVKLDIGGDGLSVPVVGAMPVSGTVNANTGLAQGLTDAELRATAVPVSGPVTDAQLRATPVPVDVAGELLEAIEAMRFAIQALTRTMGQMLPDTASRMRVNVETGTLTTVSTLTNQTQIGSFAATEQIPSLMRLGADSLRRNISVN